MSRMSRISILTSYDEVSSIAAARLRSHKSFKRTYLLRGRPGPPQLWVFFETYTP